VRAAGKTKAFHFKILDEKHALLKETFPLAASTCEGCAAENCVHRQVADFLGYVIGKCDLKTWRLA
jgi:hypothetical protein